MTATVTSALVLGATACSAQRTPISHKAPPRAAPAMLVVDAADTPKLPEKFREVTDRPSNPGGGPMPDLDGFADLRESGSGALSAQSMASVKQHFAARGVTRVIDVDLRQEPHLFVNGMGVSWFGDRDDVNIGMSDDAILSDEAEKKAALARESAVGFQSIPGKSVRLPGSVRPRTVQTEEELARAEGLGYFGLAVPDHHRPENGEVDRFVAFARDLPAGTWLHFHCRGGVGRTTTFMTLYDVMRNAKRVGLDDIMKRQVLIGGKDLLSPGAIAGDAFARERAAFIRQFYDYARQNQDGFRTSFSLWLSRGGR